MKIVTGGMPLYQKSFGLSMNQGFCALAKWHATSC